MSRVEERVTFYEDRGGSVPYEHFWRVEIKYADGATFYKGWIQDFGEKDSLRAGPTVYPINYVKYHLDPDEANKRAEYWEEIEFDPATVTVRVATESDLDELIDLNFQNYFEGENNRISAYQGLNFLVDESHTIFCLEVNERVLGFLFVEWQIDTEGNKAAYLDNLYCAPAIRGHGLNFRLLAAAIEKAKQKGCQLAHGLIIGSEEHYMKIVRALQKSDFTVGNVTMSVGPPLVASQWYDVHVSVDLA